MLSFVSYILDLLLLSKILLLICPACNVFQYSFILSMGGNNLCIVKKYMNNGLKDTLWVSAPSTLDLCVFAIIFAIYACKLT